MKTIEEAANEHIKESHQLFTRSKKSFKAGLEFAQKWYDVNEELPRVGELVQVKYYEVIGKKSIKYDHDSIIEPEENVKIFSMEQCAVKVIAWRPIELK